MKISFNLATTPGFRDRYGLLLAAPGLIIGLAILVWFSTSAVTNFRKYHQMEQTLVKVRAKQEYLRQKEASLQKDLRTPEYQRLIQESGYVNQLIAQRQFSLTELTAKVSQLMPPDVRLDGLGLVSSEENPLVRFSIEGKSEESLEAFLTKLEGDTSDFSDVVVTSQGFAQAGTNGGQILATCTAHYLGAVLPPATPTDFDAETTTESNSSNR